MKKSQRLENLLLAQVPQFDEDLTEKSMGFPPGLIASLDYESLVEFGSGDELQLECDLSEPFRFRRHPNSRPEKLLFRQPSAPYRKQ
jgi:hypothetical protein